MSLHPMPPISSHLQHIKSIESFLDDTAVLDEGTLDNLPEFMPDSPPMLPHDCVFNTKGINLTVVFPISSQVHKILYPNKSIKCRQELKVEQLNLNLIELSRCINLEL